ncbi:hypothetical protein [Cyclonatronum proteinivorum]|uniref:hypothetical protein n=1 Tax=Cyclonatronum proteinivorum TaxID=1457365 RepID=UPI000F5205B6|nr:hypothetical protein [Cyclonatronum proteinivorum]
MQQFFFHTHKITRNQIRSPSILLDPKQALSLNEIKAKLRSTSETWIAATLFVLNLTAFANQAGFTF